MTLCRALKIAIAAGLVLVLVSGTGLRWSALAYTHKPYCRLVFANGGERCFAPSQLDGAEVMMPAPPVDPSSVVNKVAHVRLKAVILTVGLPYDPTARIVTGIHLIYGSAPLE